MKRELIFSARYAAVSEYQNCYDKQLEPERWAADFLDSKESRTVLAGRLIEEAKYLSVTGALDMDIYTSPHLVQIELYLDQTLYFSAQMQQLAVLLWVCDELSISVENKLVNLSLSYTMLPL